MIVLLGVAGSGNFIVYTTFAIIYVTLLGKSTVFNILKQMFGPCANLVIFSQVILDIIYNKIFYIL